MKKVFFDLDDTIFDFKKAERIALSKTMRELGIVPTDEIIMRYSELNISQWKRLELGEITREEVKVNRYRLLFEELGVNLSPKLATSIYEENLKIGHYFIKDAEEVVKKLYEKYDLYIVSNGAKAVQDSRIASSGIEKYFKGIFISETVGYEKPAKEFFDYCFSQIENFDNKNAVIIGDSLSSDIRGGLNAGIKTIWYNPKNLPNHTDVHPDFEIKSLMETEDILAEI